MYIKYCMAFKTLSLSKCWETWNRTKIHGFKGRCPTVRRSPNITIFRLAHFLKKLNKKRVVRDVLQTTPCVVTNYSKSRRRDSSSSSREALPGPPRRKRRTNPAAPVQRMIATATIHHSAAGPIRMVSMIESSCHLYITKYFFVKIK